MRRWCFAVFAGLAVLARAGEDAVVRDAVVYASTPAKRERQAKAREELNGLGGEGLRRLMRYAHTENVMVTVLALERVEALPAGEAAPVLAEFLADEHARTRRMAAYFLGFLAAPEHADAVRALLADDEACGAAARTLGKWGACDAGPDIWPLLAHEREPRRVAAANALRDLGDPAAAPALIGALEDPYFTVREAAARALAALGPPAVRAMLKALPESSGPARRHLVRALGRTGSRRALRALTGLLNDPDPWVRADAGEALATLRAARGRSTSAAR